MDASKKTNDGKRSLKQLQSVRQRTLTQDALKQTGIEKFLRDRQTE